MMAKNGILRSSQDSNLGPLNSSQMLLYQLSHWSSGIGAEDRWRLSIDITYKVAAAITQFAGCSKSTSVLIVQS